MAVGLSAAQVPLGGLASLRGSPVARTLPALYLAAAGARQAPPLSARPGIPGFVRSAGKKGRATGPWLAQHQARRQGRSPPTTMRSCPPCSPAVPVAPPFHASAGSAPGGARANITDEPDRSLDNRCRKPGHLPSMRGGRQTGWVAPDRPGVPSRIDAWALSSPGRRAGARQTSAHRPGLPDGAAMSPVAPGRGNGCARGQDTRSHAALPQAGFKRPITLRSEVLKKNAPSRR